MPNALELGQLHLNQSNGFWDDMKEDVLNRGREERGGERNHKGGRVKSVFAEDNPFRLGKEGKVHQGEKSETSSKNSRDDQTVGYMTVAKILFLSVFPGGKYKQNMYPISVSTPRRP